MNNLCKVVIALCIIVNSLLGNTRKVSIESGEIFIKKIFETVSIPLTDTSIIDNGDTLFVEPSKSASFFINEKQFLHFEHSCKVVYEKVNNKITFTLLNGQLFFIKHSKTIEQELEISADECNFVPMGTSAAIKIIPDVGPSIAVLEGNVQMVSSDGIQRNVVSGQYCSYYKKMKQFGAINELPEKSANYLQSLVPEKMKKEELKTEENTNTTQLASTDNTKQNEPKVIQKDTSSTNSESERGEETVDEGSTDSSKKTESASKIESPGKLETPKEDEKGETEKKDPDKPEWGIDAGVVSVGDEVWTRVALSVDIPIWRFGVCFDLELYLDQKGNFNNKGWNFDSWKDAGNSLLGKIKYVRLNHLGDPLFIKVGGLDNVTLGYGFIVDRFTNMLKYPGEKLFGLQFDLNSVSPIGITFQTVIPDFMEFGDEGGVIGSRFALTPLKSLSVPVLNGVTLGGTFAIDINQYAPARRWDYTLFGTKWDMDEDNITDSTYLYNEFSKTSYYDSIVLHYKNNNDYDAKVEHKDQWAKKEYDIVMLTGADLIIPILSTKLLSLDLYGQMGMMINDEDEDESIKGWGFGAPGVGLKLAPFWARAEYRHIRDEFMPEYFDTYYLKDRIIREPSILVKEKTLRNTTLNGVFAQCGFNILDFVVLDGRGQYLIGKEDSTGDKSTDFNVDATLSFGEVLISKIPKINQIQLFYYQTDIEGNLFQKSISTHWGYTLGVEVIQGASLIWRTDYGWKKDKNGKWIDDKVVTITAGLSF